LPTRLFPIGHFFSFQSDFCFSSKKWQKFFSSVLHSTKKKKPKKTKKTQKKPKTTQKKPKKKTKKNQKKTKKIK